MNCFQNVSLAYRLQWNFCLPWKACVVNCFQNVSLAYRLQWIRIQAPLPYCCELLSKCIFGISFTIWRWDWYKNDLLWIAFKMYLWHIVYNFELIRLHLRQVVNCFQNVSLAYRLQLVCRFITFCVGCELLSKCIFGISFTILDIKFKIGIMLWIAFKMYLWHIVYNFLSSNLHYFIVVNCFQNVSLAYRLQSKKFFFDTVSSCELLSKCIFGISFTIKTAFIIPFWQLWIAFKMYLWHIVYNLRTAWKYKREVVNCFQNVSLAYRLQWIWSMTTPCLCCELLSKCIFGISFTIFVLSDEGGYSCELLSKCIFGISFTIQKFERQSPTQLWIAFKMYLWHIVYNTPTLTTWRFWVVNCFQNVSLAYRLQLNLAWNTSFHWLWIAFKMYLWHIVYNGAYQTKLSKHVVNCFQNVSLAYRLQSLHTLLIKCTSCELLSKCIFGISFTIKWKKIHCVCRLWIAFKMYLWHIVYNIPCDKSLRIN